MKPELTVIKSIPEIEKLIEYLSDKEYVAYDCETTGLTKQDEVIGLSVCAEESKAYYIVLKEWGPDDVRGVGHLASPWLGIAGYVPELLKVLKTKKLIMHNSVFDCMMAEAFFKVDLMPSVHTDTMILAHLIDENRRVGLKELASSIFGEDSANEQREMKESVLKNGGKLTKKCYEMWKCDSQILGKYGAKDALLTYKLFLHLVPHIYEKNLDKFFYEEESMPLLRGPTYDLNTVGLAVDSPRLQTLKKTLQAECAEAKAFIYKEIDSRVKDKYPGTNKNNTFNIGACQQLSWLLFGEYQLEFGNLTKAGKTLCKNLGLKLPYTKVAKRSFIAEVQRRKGELVLGKKIRDPWCYIAADKSVLKKLASKYKWIETLLEYQKKTKLLTTYVEGIEERTQYGTIQPHFLQHGTTSGRYSSRNPNFQNLPRDDKRIKSCIKARPGKILVGADYSQLEPRVFASISGDESLLKAFKEGHDAYSVVGIKTYDKTECSPQKDGEEYAFGVMYPKLRQDAKTFMLASTYGATGYQLAPLMGKTPDEAQQDIDAYFEKFPKVREMMNDSHEMAKKDGQVVSLFGRPRRIPLAKNIQKLYKRTPDNELPYEARKLLNLACNHRIQSTAASIVNRSAIKLLENCREAHITCKLVLQVHDSLVVECNEADAKAVAVLMRYAMENTCHLGGIELEAVPKIGNNLAEV